MRTRAIACISNPETKLPAAGTLESARRWPDVPAHLTETLSPAPPPTSEELDRLGQSLLEQGRRTEAVHAFDQAVALDPRYLPARIHLGDALRALGDLPHALVAYQTALMLQPLDLLLRRRIAGVFLAMRHAAAAEGLLRDILNAAPHDPAVLADLALALCEQKRFEEVPALCERALKLAPDTANAHVALSLAFTAADRLDEAEAACHRAIALAPKLVEARINLAVCHLEKNRRREVVTVCEEALAFEPNCQEARWNLGLAQLALGNFAEGWEHYELRKNRGFGGADRMYSAPEWDGVAPLQQRTILLHAEQGLGDTLQFARYVRFVAAAGANVLLEVQAPLRALCASLPGVAGVFARGDSLPPFHLHCPLLSLPRVFHTRPETIPADVPYFSVDPAKKARWQEALGGGCKIGLVWSGNPAHGRDCRRSIPLAKFALLTQATSPRFFALQKELRPADAALLPTLAQVHDLAPELHDFTETAAVVASLDLVITVDTAVAHLAGALGRPVWVLLPFAADWRWLMDRADTPWYPTMRLFRQSATEEWDSVLAVVRRALEQFCPAAPAKSDSS